MARRTSRTKQKTVIITAQLIVAKTEKAVLVQIENADEVERHWLPLSQIELPKGTRRDDEDVDIIIPCWLAEEKGIE